MGCRSAWKLTAGKTCSEVSMVTSKLDGPGPFPSFQVQNTPGHILTAF